MRNDRNIQRDGAGPLEPAGLFPLAAQEGEGGVERLGSRIPEDPRCGSTRECSVNVKDGAPTGRSGTGAAEGSGTAPSSTTRHGTAGDRVSVLPDSSTTAAIFLTVGGMIFLKL